LVCDIFVASVPGADAAARRQSYVPVRTQIKSDKNVLPPAGARAGGRENRPFPGPPTGPDRGLRLAVQGACRSPGDPLVTLFAILVAIERAGFEIGMSAAGRTFETRAAPATRTSSEDS
jgi:hypothetical protein